jgi:amino acid transporter
VLLSLVLTGAVHYQKFEYIGDPLAFIFEPENLNIGWMQFLVSLCAVIAMTSVLLVFQMGQPRIWMSISRDGLLPKIFQKIHPEYKTPSFSTILTGFVVGVPILFTDKNFVLDFTSIGTLFAFVLVCGGVLLIPYRAKTNTGFHLPYVDGRFIFPSLVILSMVFVFIFYPHYFPNLFQFSLPQADIDFIKQNMIGQPSDVFQHLLEEKENALFIYNLSTIVFWLVMCIMSILAYTKRYSLIPLLGLSTCLYLLTGMSMSNWIWFGSWLILGIVIYFGYGYHHSRLKK